MTQVVLNTTHILSKASSSLLQSGAKRCKNSFMGGKSVANFAKFKLAHRPTKGSVLKNIVKDWLEYPWTRSTSHPRTTTTLKLSVTSCTMRTDISFQYSRTISFLTIFQNILNGIIEEMK